MESLKGSDALYDLKRSKSIAGHLDDEREKLLEAGGRHDDFRLLLRNAGMTDRCEKRVIDPCKSEKRVTDSPSIEQYVSPNESNKHLAGENTDRRLIPFNDGRVTDLRKSERKNIINGSPQTRAISIKESPRNENVMTYESNEHLVRVNTDRRLIPYDGEIITHPCKRERKNIINGSPQTRVISIRGSPKRDLMARENNNMEIIRVLPQPERDQPGCSGTKHCVENQIRASKVVNRNIVSTRDQRGERNGVVWNDKEYFYERRVSRDFKVISEHDFFEKTRCVQKYPKKSRKLADGLSMAKRDLMAMVKARRKQIEITDEVVQIKKGDAESKRSLEKLELKDAFEGNNEDNRRAMIFNKNEYFYEKNSRVIKGDRHANFNRAQLVKGKRLVRGDYERNGFVNVNRAQPVKRKRLIRGDYEYEQNGLINVNRAQPVKGKRLICGDNEYEQNGFVQKGNKRFKENHDECVDQFQSNKTKVLQSGNKFEKMIKQVDEANKRHVIVLDSEDSCGECGPVKRNRFNRVNEYTVGSRSKLKKVVKQEGQNGNCSKLHENNSTENIAEKDTDDETSIEVEILDSAEVIKQGKLSPFVPSTIYRCDFGVSEASSDYRERVLKVLKKPFVKEEYRRLSEEVQSYLGKYPDLKKKLKKYRYKRLTRVTILRGFFYWLQNVMHDEAFRPWEDPQCLAVQPGSD